MKTFYLGTHLPSWVSELKSTPLFISDSRLAARKNMPIATTRWSLDSRGFTMLRDYGRYIVSKEEYASRVRRYYNEIGLMDWAAIQDWMCEPFILQKTGLTISQHQQRTVQSYIDLLTLDCTLPWLPVLQGFELDDYKRCLDLYRANGFNNIYYGLGSVCRRQHTEDAENIIRCLSSEGIKLHAFGFKVRGLRNVSSILESADSMAWSFEARNAPPMSAECYIKHNNCANCIDYAIDWYNKIYTICNATSN